jgi:hypothetical protein
MSPAAATLASVLAIISTSRSVPVSDSRLLRALISTLARIGMVCRRSTTPITLCRGPRNCSRLRENFMAIFLS